MGSVGLLYVGAILFINGLALMGLVKGTGASPLNWFVGFMQVVTPTYLIFTADGNADQIFGAAGLYLFGFTYLYVAFNNTWGHDGTGLGYYSLFVAVVAIGYVVVNIVRYQDYASAASWLLWALLWYLFYLLLGKGRDIGWITGLTAAIQGWITGTIPAFMMLAGLWSRFPNWLLGAIQLVAFAILIAVFQARKPAPATSENIGSPEPVPNA